MPYALFVCYQSPTLVKECTIITATRKPTGEGIAKFWIFCAFLAFPLLTLAEETAAPTLGVHVAEHGAHLSAVEVDNLPPGSLVHDIVFDHDDLIPPGDWHEDSGVVLSECQELANAVQQLGVEEFERLGAKGFAKAVDKGKVSLTTPIGHAEINTIDDHYFARVVHENTKYSLVFLDREKIKPHSKHLRQYVARQHIDAGEVQRKKRSGVWDHVKGAFVDGSRTGRDVVLVWYEKGEIKGTEYLPRFSPFSGEWWGDYYYATVKKPTRGDYILGTVSTAAQLGMTEGVMWIKEVINPEYEATWAPLVMSAGFGVVLGVGNSTYRNWIYRGSDLSQLTKQWSVSMGYAYGLTIWEKGLAVVFRITDTAALAIHAHLWSNSWFHNLGRKSWYEFPRIRTQNRDNSETFKITWKGKEIDTDVSRASAEQQTLYLVPYTLKLIGLVGLGAGVATGVGTIDSGTLLLLASIPAAQYGVMKYAESKRYRDQVDLRRRWERTKSIGKTIPLTAAQILGIDPTHMDASLSHLSEKCATLISRIAWRTKPATAGS